jgi:hypothetical protein
MALGKVLTVAAILLAGATFAASAVATPTVIDQYTEQIPNPGGQAPPPANGQPGGNQAGPGGQADGGGDSGVTAGSSGTPGSLDPAAAGEPSETGAGTGSSDPSGGRTPGAETQSSLPFGGQSSVETGDSGSGMGPLFPLALLLIAGLTAAAVLTRRRSGARTHAS